MHLGARVVQRGDAEEHIILTLAVVLLLGQARAHQCALAVQNGLGKARRAGAKVDGGVVILQQFHRRRGRAGVDDEALHIVRKIGRVVAHEKEVADAIEPLHHLRYAAHKLRPQHQHRRIRQVKAVGDLLGGVAEVHRHRQRAGLEHTEVEGAATRCSSSAGWPPCRPF